MQHFKGLEFRWPPPLLDRNLSVLLDPPRNLAFICMRRQHVFIICIYEHIPYVVVAHLFRNRVRIMAYKLEWTTKMNLEIIVIVKFRTTYEDKSTLLYPFNVPEALGVQSHLLGSTTG